MFSKKFTNLFIIFLYFSILLGLFLNENLIGGALNDYRGLFYLTDKFRENFLLTLLNYDNFGHRQSPIFYILGSLIIEGEMINKLFFVHIFLLIPFFFYKCLKLIFPHQYNNNLKILASILFLFPTFRSYSIWPDPHLLGLLLFIIAIYFFLKFKKKNNKIKYAVLNTIFLSLSAYISPNFGVFILYFLYNYFLKFGFSKNLFIILLLNLFLCLPFFYYVFYLKINFLFDNDGWDIGKNFYSLKNISNKIIIISSIFFFFVFPLLNFKKLFINQKFKDLRNYLFGFIIFLISIYYFDFNEAYNLTKSGGGIFYYLSNFIFKNNYFLYLISLVSLLLLSKIFYRNFENTMVFICILLSNPQVTIWQANHSPTIFILIFLMFNINFLKNNFDFKNITYVYSYFVLYLSAYFAKILLI